MNSPLALRTKQSKIALALRPAGRLHRRCLAAVFTPLEFIPAANGSDKRTAYSFSIYFNPTPTRSNL